jgi:hypothetical protein
MSSSGPVFSHSAATRRIREAVFGKANRRLADYWLSLWRGDALPDWSAFRMSAVSELEPGISVFELHPENVLLCIVCGAAVARSIGMDITGKDWLALSAPDQRASRLNGFTAIARGQAGQAIRYAQHRSGEVHYVEELLLPFAAGSGGAIPVLSHIAWRPSDPFASEAEIRNSRMVPDEVVLVPLGPEPDVR